MAGLSDMSKGTQAIIMVVIGLILAGAGWFLVIQPKKEANDQQQHLLDQKNKENAELRSYVPKLDDLNRQIVTLQQQLEIQRKIVPDEKEADKFMHLMQDTASTAGIQVRRYSAQAVNTKEFYSEVPFQMDVDGQYYAVVSFFDKVAKLERIINISGLMVSTVRKPTDAKVKRAYPYNPSESIVASFVATTFFNHDSSTTVAAAKPAKGAKK
jgi:type IV pilus assembly protein PilO